jgi:hypothetical protein
MISGDQAIVRTREGYHVSCRVEGAKDEALGNSRPDAGGLEGLRSKLAKPNDAALESGEQAGDLRTLPVKYDRSGKRYRDFVESVSMLEAVEFTDFVVEGPRTYKDFVEALTRKGNSPIAYHTRWVMETGVDKKSPEALAHELGCEMIEIAHSYDQLQTSNLASFELLARWLQMIEHSVAQNPKKPDFQNQHLFLGTASRVTTGGLTNSLAKHVASRAAEEAAVLKEQRKAREERALVTKK